MKADDARRLPGDIWRHPRRRLGSVRASTARLTDSKTAFTRQEAGALDPGRNHRPDFGVENNCRYRLGLRNRPSLLTETIVSKDDLITLSWMDFLPAFAGITAPNPDRQSTHGHYAVYIPARKTRVTLNGKETAHQPIPRKRENWDNSSAFLAWAESWVRPKE
jgi:hypothetical protein